MGLLTLGTPLAWNEAKLHADYIRKHGIIQFLNIWHRVSSRTNDQLLWGDEVEYIVLDLDTVNKKARVSLHAHDALLKMEKEELDVTSKGGVFDSSWKPEYGIYMIEGTPGQPYTSPLKDLLLVEPNMKKRRAFAKQHLRPSEIIITMTSYPLLGVGEFSEPPYKPNLVSSASKSLYIPDECINPHARFPTLTANIRRRRGGKVAINMPIYKDVNTPLVGSVYKEPIPESIKSLSKSELIQLILESSTTIANPPSTEQLSQRINTANLPKYIQDLIPDAKDDSIYMDCMCFGMGCSCLQITFQACSVKEARKLYDQLAVFGPIMLALSAAAPIFRGYLADVDCRWNVISSSVDDRSKFERGVVDEGEGKFRIPKSRYDAISSFLGPGNMSGCADGDEYYKEEYNDTNLVYDKEIYNTLVDGGIDDLLARHVSHLFIRDPLVLYKEKIEQEDDNSSSDHFENIQSTNWQTLRFKPPPPQLPNMGWRVEFRSMEIQTTDFENAAFSIFVVLVTRIVLSFRLNFYVQLSKVDENMSKAHKRDSVLNEKFWFRKNIFGLKSKRQGSSESLSHLSELPTTNTKPIDEDEAELMTINEIINGKQDSSFPGLAPLIESYLQSLHLDYATHCQLLKYVNHIKQKASGEIPTTARWIRNFVQSHKSYKGDSKVGDEIVFDLVREMDRLASEGDQISGDGCGC